MVLKTAKYTQGDTLKSKDNNERNFTKSTNCYAIKTIMTHFPFQTISSLTITILKFLNPLH